MFFSLFWIIIIMIHQQWPRERSRYGWIANQLVFCHWVFWWFSFFFITRYCCYYWVFRLKYISWYICRFLKLVVLKTFSDIKQTNKKLRFWICILVLWDFWNLKCFIEKPALRTGIRFTAFVFHFGYSFLFLICCMLWYINKH